MSAHVYILKDQRGHFYVGSTADINRRIRQHKQGHTPATKRMVNPKLALKQEYPSLRDARLVERKIKRLKRKDYIDKMVKDGYIRIK